MVAVPLDSSTVMTPSLPTLSKASAMILPISTSLLPAMAATCATESVLDRDGVGLERGDCGLYRLVDALLDAERRAARSDIAQTFVDDRLGEDRRSRRAVAGDVVGLRRDFADELGAHVLELIVEFDFLGDRHAIPW